MTEAKAFLRECLTRISRKHFPISTILHASKEASIGTGCRAGAQHAAPVRLLADMRTTPDRQQTRRLPRIYCEKCGLDRGAAALSSLERTQSEKLMPAGFAAQRGQSENTPKGRRHPVDVIRRNALQVEVTADGTVCVKQMVKGNCPRVKTRLAGHAAPRQHVRGAEQIVERRLAP